MTKLDFETLYTNNYKKWHRVAYAMVQNHDQAHDIVQEVACRLMAGKWLEKLNSTQNPASWVHRYIVFYVNNYIWINPRTLLKMEHHTVSLSEIENMASFTRTNRNKDEYVQPDDLVANNTPYPQGVACGQFDPETPDALETKTPLEQAVQGAFDSLDPTSHDILCMVVYGNMPQTEIAKVLKIPYRLVRDLLRTAKLKVRWYLENVGISAPPCDDNTTPAKDQSAV